MKNVIPALILLLPCLVQAEAPAGVALERGARSFVIRAPGIEEFEASWSAVIVREGKRMPLPSNSGEPGGGSAGAIRFPVEQAELLIHVERVAGAPAIAARAGIRNTGATPLFLEETTPVSAELRVAGDPAQWLVTGLHPNTPVAVCPGSTREPVAVHEYGGCYREDGIGFFWGAVGIPTAYVNAKFVGDEAGKLAMSIASDTSGVQVDPGETRWGQEVVLVFAPPQQAIAQWAGWVAQSHGALTQKGPLTGWSNASPLHKTDIREELIAVTETARKSGGQLRLGLVAIDDVPGDVRATLDAPWVPDCAKRVGKIGARFGIRLAFDGSADLTSITGTVRHAVQRGFTYLKIAHPVSDVARGAKRTTFEAYRDEFTAIRRAAGEDVYLTYGGNAPNRAVVGLVDASRVGRDPRREDLRPPMDDILRSSFLANRWFAADYGNVFLGTYRANPSQVNGGWEMARLWLSMVALSAGSAITSDPLPLEQFHPYWPSLQIQTPGLKKPLAVLDLCTGQQGSSPRANDLRVSRGMTGDEQSPERSRLIGHFHRDWGESTVFLLWNPSQSEERVIVDFAQAGMDPRRPHIVYAFWENRILAVVSETWWTHRMTPTQSQTLRFTPFDKRDARPFLIGSNLHISCGNEEIQSIQASKAAMTIELTGAGSIAGDLFIHSSFPPILKNSTGCSVGGITIVGENSYRIPVWERNLSAPQRIELAFLLPTTQQPWFQIAIAAVVASTVVALWRYIVSLRLQRQQNLAEERARIAQDLHDDLGASLAQIAFHGDSLLDGAELPPKDATRIEKMRQIARSTTRALDEIVWAVDPRQDTLESFTGYLCSFAQEVLANAGVKCRFDLPDNLPANALPSKTRHHVFLAFKEALNNILRHARASEVRVRLAIIGKEFLLELADDGCGFEPDKAAGRTMGGHGLGNLRDRMRAIGGRCDLTSEQGAGTRIRFFWNSKS